MADAMQQFRRSILEKEWQFRDGSEPTEKWIPVAKVPSVVHLDLLDNGKIPDPFEGMNELDVDWIGERTWVYRTTFATPSIGDSTQADLVFDGLDTIATVYLNDEVILRSDNMFLGHRVSVTKKLRSGSDNDLMIVFDSALFRGRELEKEHVEHKFIAWNGETGRLGVRKAQYHWGWDWGPVLMTAGPWKPVALETYQSRIDDIWMNYDLSDDLNSVSGTLNARVAGHPEEVVFKLALGEETIVTTKASNQTNGVLSATFKIANPTLWYPHGYGQQSRYTFSAEVLAQGASLHQTSKEVGFRQVKLVQKPDAIGESFYLKVNGIDVFCGGSCWIPADNILPRISDDKYRKWLTCMKDGNQIMVRVWGGGIYEQDVFYSICDELGLLVWQDFMFACGSYPVWPALLDSIKREATYNCRRIRHHPSIVIYAGTNEDYQVAESNALDYQQSDDPEVWLKSNFPARYIYEYLLPLVTAEEVPGSVYWPCSPFTGGGKQSSDLTIGDVHQWNVWHGTQEKYQKFPEIGGRFNSEFGMAALPSMQTIKSFVKDESELYPQSRTMDFHNKADGHERRIATYVLENFRNAADLPTWLYLTQLMQSETMLYAYRDWRRQWGDSRRCGGALVWQLNDCWPCSSWAIVDYYHRPKPAYYAIKRQLKPVAVGVRRQHHDWSVCHARPAKSLAFSVWVMSSKLQSEKADVELRFISIGTGKETRAPIFEKGAEIKSNGTTEVFQGNVQGLGQEPVVLAARLFIAGECVSRDVDWPQPYKYIKLDNSTVSLKLNGEDLTISTEKPVKGLVIEEQDGVSLNDNCVDLVPGDDQVIHMRGFKGDIAQLKWKSLV